MDLIICFIDDSDFEHDLVREEIAPLAPDLIFIQAYTFAQAEAELGNRIPGLFLLDLWGQDPDVKEPVLTPKEQLDEIVARFNTLDDVYEGLGTYGKDRNNEYLRRIFTIVDGWRNLFELVCNRIGQNRKYGLSNLARARIRYPGVPGVFYTRKSLIHDAVAMFKAHADGLFIKPTGIDDAATRELTRKNGPYLIRELTGIVDSRIRELADSLVLYGEKNSLGEDAVRNLIRDWKKFINKKKRTTSLP